MSTTLSISYQRQERATTASVQLEMEPWDAYTGKLTRLGVVAYLNQLLFGDDEEIVEDNNCGTDADSGCYIRDVYAYPSPPELNYVFGVAGGQHLPPRRQELEYAEIINVDEGGRPSLTYPTTKILEASWVSEAFSADGATLPAPPIIVDGGSIDITSDAYGAIYCKYMVIRDVYATTVCPRKNAKENKLQAWAWAVWECDNCALELNPPDDTADTCATRFSSSVKIDDDDDRVPGPVAPVDKIINIDYCTGKP